MFIREIKNAVKAAVNAIFPQVCMGCGEIIDSGEYFCDFCHDENADLLRVTATASIPSSTLKGAYRPSLTRDL